MVQISQGSTGASGYKIQGQVAQGVADSGNPLKIGAYAITALPTAVANAQDTNIIADKFGRSIVLINSIRDLVTQNTVTLSTTSETTILSGVVSTFIDITSIIVTNTSSTAVRVDFRDATAGTVRLPVWVNANSGAVINPVVPYIQTSANNNWTAQLSGAVTDVRIFMQGVQNK